MFTFLLFTQNTVVSIVCNQMFYNGQFRADLSHLMCFSKQKIFYEFILSFDYKIFTVDEYVNDFQVTFRKYAFVL